MIDVIYGAHVTNNLSIVLANAKVTVGVGRLFKVRLGSSVDITVAGLPVPTVLLKKNNADVNSDKCQLKGDILQISPVEESDYGAYSITASNCFGSATESFTIDVLSQCRTLYECVYDKLIFCLLAPPSTDTADRSISAVCSQTVVLLCNGSGNPQSDITWTFTPVYSSQQSRIEAPNSTPLGWMKYQSVLSLYNVQGGKSGNEGTYQCLINNTIGDAAKVIFILSVTCEYVNENTVSFIALCSCFMCRCA